MKLKERFNAPTPKFWKKVRNISGTIAGIGGLLLTAPVSIPAGLITLGGYLLLAGTVGASLSQLTKEDGKEPN